MTSPPVFSIAGDLFCCSTKSNSLPQTQGSQWTTRTPPLNILKDLSHLAHRLLTPLASGRCFRGCQARPAFSSRPVSQVTVWKRTKAMMLKYINCVAPPPLSVLTSRSHLFSSQSQVPTPSRQLLLATRANSRTHFLALSPERGLTVRC